MRAFVKDVQEMAERGEEGKVSRYLTEMEKEVLPLYSTGNQALDSVLMVKVAKIQAQGIEFRGTNLHYTGGMNIKDSILDNYCSKQGKPVRVFACLLGIPKPPFTLRVAARFFETLKCIRITSPKKSPGARYH